MKRTNSYSVNYTVLSSPYAWQFLAVTRTEPIFKKYVKFALDQAVKTQMGSGGIAPLFIFPRR